MGALSGIVGWEVVAVNTDLWLLREDDARFGQCVDEPIDFGVDAFEGFLVFVCFVLGFWGWGLFVVGLLLGFRLIRFLLWLGFLLLLGRIGLRGAFFLLRLFLGRFFFLLFRFLLIGGFFFRLFLLGVGLFH